MIKIITTGAKSVLPFSPAIKAGDFVYVSGQASVDRENGSVIEGCLLYTSPSPRDVEESRMPSSA